MVGVYSVNSAPLYDGAGARDYWPQCGHPSAPYMPQATGPFDSHRPATTAVAGRAPLTLKALCATSWWAEIFDGGRLCGDRA